MKKLCLAAICMLITAGCGDSSPTSDSETGESTGSAETTNAESTETAGDAIADESTPFASADKSSQPTTEVATGPEDKTAHEEPGAEATSIDDQIAQIEEERSAAMKKFREWYDSASDEEKKTDFQERYPDPEVYSARVLKLATDSPDTPAAETALLWVAQNSRGPKAAEAIGILLEKHGDNEEIASTLPMLAYGFAEANEKVLRKAAEGGQSERIKGMGTLALAQFLQRVPTMRQMVEDNPELAEQLGDQLSYIKNFEVDNDELEKLYSTAVEKYGTITTARGTIAETAEAALYELRNLQIGMVAPDIEGADLDGTEFKLSDYRGKVVLLDFWGNW